MEPIHPLKAFRQREGLSQEAFAELIGVDRVTVARWETGQREIGKEHLPVVSAKTGIPRRELRPDLAELLGGQ